MVVVDWRAEGDRPPIPAIDRGHRESEVDQLLVAEAHARELPDVLG